MKWVGAVVIALVTLIVSDIWREMRPTVFGWKWGDGLHLLATTPYVHVILAGFFLPLLALWLFHRRFKFSFERPGTYFKVFALAFGLGNIAVFTVYLLFSGATSIMDEWKVGGLLRLICPCA